jgi:signal transduction histidine kinase
MGSGLRARLALALLAAAVLGWLYLTWASQLFDGLVHHFRRDGMGFCSAGWQAVGYSCDPRQFTGPYGVLLLGGVTVLVLAGLAGLLVWSLAPVRRITRTIGRFGPQNLGERAAMAGRRDELGRLGEAVDRMLDRVTEGYEGQRRFASNASHELRTPLALQRTLIEVSMAGDPTPEQLELLSRQLLQTNERNEHLIEGLLVLAESDQGLRARTPQRLDLLAADTAAVYSDLARAAEVEVVTDLEPVTVFGEMALLERLLANLIGNGIKYNAPGGAVVVRVRMGGPVLEVDNDGPAVPAELVPGLFEPFRRVRGDRLDHSGGAGLGLTIARSIVTAHGGTIAAEGRPHGGLHVSVALPGAEPAEDAPAAAAAPGPLRVPAGYRDSLDVG